MKHTGHGKDRMGNGDKDGLRFTWHWLLRFKTDPSRPKPGQTCDTDTLPHWWRLTVDAHVTRTAGVRYEPSIWREDMCIMQFAGRKTRLDAQRAAEDALEALLADSLRDCFGYAIEE